jgi:hypothetical protein
MPEDGIDALADSDWKKRRIDDRNEVEIPQSSRGDRNEA